MSKIVTRIQCAFNDNETDVIEQFYQDFTTASEDGICDTEEYDITYDPEMNTFTIQDHVNEELSVVNAEISGIESFRTSFKELASEESVEFSATALETEMVKQNLEDPESKPIENINSENPEEDDSEKPIESLKEFSGSFKNGNLVMRIGDYDIMLDFKNQRAEVLGENKKFPIDMSKSFEETYDSICENLKKAGLKDF